MSLNCETIKIILAGDENAMYDRVSVTNLNIGWRDFQRSSRVKRTLILNAGMPVWRDAYGMHSLIFIILKHICRFKLRTYSWVKATKPNPEQHAVSVSIDIA